MPKAVVILQDDPARAQDLASKIRSISEVVFIAQSLAELQRMASQFPIPMGVLDLGLVTLQEIVRLRLQLGMQIVCTHHTPDEVMWTEAMDAGALDCCFDDDGQAICRAIHRAAMSCNQTTS
jgi:DNA-binding response OmpR family regulator